MRITNDQQPTAFKQNWLISFTTPIQNMEGKASVFTRMEKKITTGQPFKTDSTHVLIPDLNNPFGRVLQNTYNYILEKLQPKLNLGRAMTPEDIPADSKERDLLDDMIALVKGNSVERARYKEFET